MKCKYDIWQVSRQVYKNVWSITFAQTMWKWIPSLWKNPQRSHASYYTSTTEEMGVWDSQLLSQAAIRPTQEKAMWTARRSFGLWPRGSRDNNIMHSQPWEKIKSTVESHFGFFGSNYNFKGCFGKTVIKACVGHSLKMLGWHTWHLELFGGYCTFLISTWLLKKLKLQDGNWR